MKRALILTAAVFSLGAGSAAFAQQERAAPDPRQAPPSAASVSDADLEKFADIYVDLQKTAEKYQGEITEAESEEESLEAQTKLRDESLERLSEHGWTLDKYNTVVQAINADSSLAERAAQLIEERS